LKRLTHIGAYLAVALALGAVVLFFGIRAVERLMTFRPAQLDAKHPPSPPSGAENVWFTSADGTALHGWYFKAQTSPATATIIYFHGNGGNVTNVGWLGESWAKRGFNVLLFDYRGYGLSGGEAAVEADLYNDGDAALAFVLREKHASPERVVLYGQSLGTAIATDVASRNRCGALILESGFSSASSLASRRLPLPRWLHFLGKNRFESARKLKDVKAPVLISHGDPDSTIPTEEGRALFAAANEPKKLLIVPGAGHSVFGSAGPEYLDQLERFIRGAIAEEARVIERR
jgi:alpha-beta hydrolase superfamily lysophospholipase